MTARLETQETAHLKLRTSPQQWISGALLCICVTILLYGMGRGIDLTDESFYITWISDPIRYKHSYQPFGLILHPVFRALGDSLTALRVAGLIAVVAAGVFLGASLSYVYRLRWQNTYYHTSTLKILGAISALLVYYQWVLTPNYNLLGNIGGMLLASALTIWWRGDIDSRKWSGAAIVGVVIGSTFAFYGKPFLLIPFALATNALVLFAAKDRRWKLIAYVAISAVASLLFIAIIAIPYGSLASLIPNILHAQRLLVPELSLFSLPAKSLKDLYLSPPILTMGVVGLAAGWFGAGDTRNKGLEVLLFSLIAITILFLLSKIGIGMIRGSEPAYLGLSLISMLLLMVGLAKLSGVSGESLVAPLVLALIPFFVAVGSFNTMNEQVSASALFPLIGIAVTLCISPIRIVRSSFAAVISLLVLLLLLNAAAKPYGYGASMWSQDVETDLGDLAGPRRVDPERAESVRLLQSTAAAAGFQPGAPVIDLSGTGAGTIRLIRGRQPVLPWITSLTPSWADIVWTEMTDDERQSAWVIGPIHANFAQTKVAIDLKARSDRYVNVGTVPMIFWGRKQDLSLWRPRRERQEK